jgi:recombination protein RecA
MKEKEVFDPKVNYDKAIASLTKKYKTTKIFSMASSDFINSEVKKMSTGDLGLDAILYGGIPQGRIIKIAGKFSSAKSTVIAHYTAIKTRILKQRVFLVDYEYAWTREWLQAIGADISLITVGYPETLEEAFDMLEIMYLTGYFSDVLFETLSAASPGDEVEADNEDWTQGLKARLANKFFRKMESHQNSFVGKGVLAPTFIFTGHLFARLHDRYTPEGTSGGNQQDNSSTLILHLNRGKHITEATGEATTDDDDKGDKEVFGFFVKAKVQKNKVSPPFKTCLFGVLNEGFRGHHAHGFFHADTVCRVAERMGIIEKAGSWFNAPGIGKVQGLTSLQQKLIEDRDSFEAIVEAIRSNFAEGTKTDELPNGVQLGYQAEYAFLPSLNHTKEKPQIEEIEGVQSGNMMTAKEAAAKRAERKKRK